MKWRGRPQSGNVRDYRGRGGKVAVGGGIGGIIILVISLLFGENPLQYINTAPQADVSSEVQDERAQFVSVVLKDTEDVWNKIFTEQLSTNYREPQLALFSGTHQSGCGFASAATGPFYCPQDQTVYIDLSFYDELQSRFGASGDFAMAYVVAHEVGHHVQNLLGTLQKVHNYQQQTNKTQANAMSVKLELQADFLAGMWAYHADQLNDILEEGDIQEALTAANAIGDDRLQSQAQGYVVPESFTHGTSEQRMYWFKKGYDTGRLSEGNTFEEVE